MEMPKPNEYHRKLQKLAGHWIGEERMQPSPFDPQGGTATGRVHNRSALDGFVVVQDYEQERHGQVNFRGHAVFSWDAGAQCFVLHWWDSMGTPPNIFRGDFQGEVLTLSCDDSQVKMRAVWDFAQPGRYRHHMEVSPDGQQWFPFMEGEYERQGA